MEEKLVEDRYVLENIDHQGKILKTGSLFS